MPGVPHVGWEGPSAVAGLSTVGMLDSGGGFPHCWLHGLVGHEAAAGPLVVSLVLTAAAWAAQGGDGEHAGLVPAYCRVRSGVPAVVCMSWVGRGPEGWCMTTEGSHGVPAQLAVQPREI